MNKRAAIIIALISLLCLALLLLALFRPFHNDSSTAESRGKYSIRTGLISHNESFIQGETSTFKLNETIAVEVRYPVEGSAIPERGSRVSLKRISKESNQSWILSERVVQAGDTGFVEELQAEHIGSYELVLTVNSKVVKKKAITIKSQINIKD